eukprot:CAMPEP_0170592600 /NCGR_PEP_ID=MMETSP0224-20130122/13008_1 /TAXON_ID=285029 /ORGANISM="Togula jolla, Strain CCCM 725" /LENGTH=377 /DNA_ID=CAMNT_0010916511 /DNA_START=73 /DNA_END=1206 /DNA_ORIENTATION=+
MAMPRSYSIVVATLTLTLLSSTQAQVLSSVPSSPGFEQNDLCVPELMLLQADVQILKPASKPLAQVPQGALRSSGHGPATFSELLAEKGSQAPDISAKINEINATIAQVYVMVGDANSTAMETLNSVLNMSRQFTSALIKLQVTADSMKMLLGEDTVATVVSLAGKVTAIMDAVTVKLESYSDKVQSTLQHALAKFTAEKEKVHQMFLKAFEKVNALAPASNGTSLLQQGRTKGLPNWFKKIFGMGGSSSPCDEAKSAIQQANGTVSELYDMLGSLNATMCQDVLDESVAAASNALAQAKESFDDAMARYADQLPPSLMDPVKAAAGNVFAAASELQASVNEEKEKLQDMIVAAQTQATSVYIASQSLADAANATCA